MQCIEEIILLGDFSATSIKWSALSASSDFSSNLCDMNFQHNYMCNKLTTQHIFMAIFWTSLLSLRSSVDTVSDINLAQEFNQVIKSNLYLANQF